MLSRAIRSRRRRAGRIARLNQRTLRARVRERSPFKVSERKIMRVASVYSGESFDLGAGCATARVNQEFHAGKVHRQLTNRLAVRDPLARCVRLAPR